MIIIILIYLIILLCFYLLNNILKKNIENYQGLLTTDFYDQINKREYIIDKDNKTLTYNNKTVSYDKHFNSNESIINAKNKIITSNILSKNDVPIPSYIKIDLSSDIVYIQKQIKEANIKYPVVIKPINGTFGIDVMTDIETKDELTDTINILKDKYNDAMLEEQISGDCYRIFVFNNKIIDVIKREKPYVIGDNKNTIKELIDLRNIEQKEMNLMEVKNISEIVIKKQGYNLDSIPNIGDKIYISNVINMHNGARISRIKIEDIPKKNIDLFLKVNKAMNITCSGLDFLSDDITIEYDINNGRILEVNGTPDTEIHQKIKNYNFFERVVNSIF
jgi:D-alanine-D-alanine ligase-like ATP-grasp enzyme